MRYVVIGLGNLGRRRRAVLGDRCVGTVDPVAEDADHRELADLTLDGFDAAVLAVPSAAKLELLEHLLTMKKSVLVEKPLVVPDRPTLERLERIALGGRVCWYTAYNHRFEPLIVRLRDAFRAGTIGRLYYARMLYANGTAANVKGTWRDTGLGVVEDLACHLFDLVTWIMEERPAFEPIVVERHETNGPDHAIVMSGDRRLVLEMSYLSWRNRFSLELIGSAGSLRLDGLRKWGGADLVHSKRILPSGVPVETLWHDEGADVTWELDLAEFERRAADGSLDTANDWWISEMLRACGRGPR